MRTRWATTVRLLVGSACVGAVVLAAGMSSSIQEHQQAQHHEAVPHDARPSEIFAKHHAEVHEHLGHIDEKVRGLSESSNPQGEMHAIARLFDQYIRSHAEGEEMHLYPVVDRYASPDAAHGFTATMRFEHRVVGDWIDQLTEMASGEDPDPRAFARRAQRLLGLLEAHFLAEEQVLMPVLDEHMSGEEFLEQVLRPMDH